MNDHEIADVILCTQHDSRTEASEHPVSESRCREGYALDYDCLWCNALDHRTGLKTAVVMVFLEFLQFVVVPKHHWLYACVWFRALQH